MNETPLLNLITDFVNDFRQPAILWQALLILACMALSWLLVRQLRVFLHNRAEAAAVPATPEALQRTDSFIRILTPVLAAMLLGIAQHFLAKLQSVNLLSIAIPLCTSMALVRFGFYVLRRIFARHGDISPTMLLLEKIFTVVVWAGMALYITGLWPELHTFLESIIVPLGTQQGVRGGHLASRYFGGRAAGAGHVGRHFARRAPDENAGPAHLLARGDVAHGARRADPRFRAGQPVAGGHRPDRAVRIWRRASAWRWASACKRSPQTLFPVSSSCSTAV